MGNKMLIDAAHPEETRVVVVRGNRIEEFDFEAANRKQLRGNIYLAKVTRVEPSLQAAFVDYGGNRHGFLAFSEIHPDYYQIPVADRQALLEQDREDDAIASASETDESAEIQSAADIPEEPEADSATEDSETEAEETAEENSDDDGNDTDADTEGSETDGNGESVESVGAEDAMEEVPQRKRTRRRDYKIQEVIKRRQIILVQVVKEERGNKGAALTTYLSLAGRYCVLMPNTARGGGISRKITDAQDRKRLKDVAKSIDVPDGTGLIVRTAGANRTKTEIKRDFDYLLRLWENVRDLTLKSTAPNLVYEEGSLIKRSIRDLYTKDVDSVLVDGETAYKEAKEFMKMLMPSHARNVKLHKDSKGIFSRNQIDTQLDALFSPQVTLPSGGYLVINQTEALVAIDVNSGKSTREHSIETTALKTNLEAAQEVGRQLRLRDLAGLVVIDFIDMEEKRNNRKVENKMKEVLKSDRARIQVGRISPFGLLEMSRQRMRSGVLEGSTRTCEHCEGRGYIRSVESCALSVLRGVEEHLLNRKSNENLIVRCQDEVAFYILNQKRDHLTALETAYNIVIMLQAGHEERGSDFVISKADGNLPPRKAKAADAVSMDSAYSDDEEEEQVEQSVDADESEEQPRKRKRRRGRRGGRRARGRGEATQASEGTDTTASQEDVESEVGEAGDEGAKAPNTARRGRRGGRKHRSPQDQSVSHADSEEAAIDPAQAPQPAIAVGEGDDPWDTTPEPVKPNRRKRKSKATDDKDDAADKADTPEKAEAKPKRGRSVKSEDVKVSSQDDADAEDKPKRKRRSAKKNDDDGVEKVAGTESEDAKPKRKSRAKKKTDDTTDGEKEDTVKTKKRTSTKKAKKDDEGKASGVKASDDAEKPINGASSSAASDVENVTAATPPAADANQPARSGWWQRKT
ncbi:MAG: Rne/Rng family ribonuclease [Hyphomicrobiales bacterium]